MVNTKYEPKPVNYAKRRATVAIPDGAMTLKEIVERFVKNIPVNVTRNPQIFLDQQDVDLEKMSRLDVTDKAFQADVLKAEAQRMQQGLEAQERATEERAIEAEKTSEAAKRGKGRQASGIDNLDNTMPDDTDTDNQQVRGRGGKK